MLWRPILAALITAHLLAAPTRADPGLDCFGEDWERRIAGCSELIERGALDAGELAQAFASRALAHSLRGHYGASVRDYDRALEIEPEFPVALNNRAWAYFKWGRGRQGLGDVEKSIALSPFSGHSYDTRAHIRQAMGESEAALADYELAIRYGGTRMVKLYQCGLSEQRLYDGPIDGIWSPSLGEALETCVRSRTCDPLPADEQCRPGISQRRGGTSRVATAGR